MSGSPEMERVETSNSNSASPQSRQNSTATIDSFLRSTQRRFTESAPPLGFLHASGTIASSLPTLKDVQKGNFNSDGWSGPGQRRNSLAHRDTDFHVLNNLSNNVDASAQPVPASSRKATVMVADPLHQIAETPNSEQDITTVLEKTKSALLAEKENGISEAGDSISNTGTATLVQPHDHNVPYENGYQFPPKHSFAQSTKIALHAFWKFFLTPFGFLVTVYGLNVVAWGGMLFLVLIGGAPAMCKPSCSDDNSAAKVWIENDSQIVNALFCVTGLGLIPWRFRDLYYLLRFRISHDHVALRRLAGINRDWFRLEGSQSLPVTFNAKVVDFLPAGVDDRVLAFPLAATPDPPLTGERAPATKVWKLDFYIWCYIWNTILQICLCGIMWGLNRFDRPGWTTGVLISFACIVAMAGGWVTFKEGKKVKGIEGVPVSAEDLELLRLMHERDLEATTTKEGGVQVEMREA